MKHMIAAMASGFALLSGAFANDTEAAVAAARDWRAAHGANILSGFVDLLSLPNDANDAENIRRNADYISGLFKDRGFQMELLESDEAPPLIYGLRETSGAERTIAIYVHYDGQPTEPAEWTHPPFQPRLYSRAMTEGGEEIAFPLAGETVDENWRLYARSASDDKAPFPALLAAIDALDEEGIGFTSNIKLIFDGEEEAGSDYLDDYLAAHADKFADVDLWLFCDGPTHQSERPQLVFGVRGVTDLEVTVYGPNRGLHSGHYGNWAPGPGWRLAQLLASMKDEKGRVLIKDFYKSTAPVSKAERAAIAAMPDIDDELRQTFGLAETEMDNAPIAERLLLPALNLKGLKSAEVGALSRNVIPPSATASIGVRLVKGNDPEEMLNTIEGHIRKMGYFITREDPDADTRARHPLIAKVTRSSGYPAMRSRMDDPRVSPLVAALRAVAGDELILNPSLGGSLPLYMFESVSDAPIVILPVANYDNNQHAADENIRIGNLFYGVDAYAAVLTMGADQRALRRGGSRRSYSLGRMDKLRRGARGLWRAVSVVGALTGSERTQEENVQRRKIRRGKVIKFFRRNARVRPLDLWRSIFVPGFSVWRGAAMKMKFEFFSVVVMATLMAACASPQRGGPKGGPNGGPNDGIGGGPRGEAAAGPFAGIGRPSALLAAAREQQAKEGCAKAAPAYRIVASYGEGYEVAQYELGACLMQMTGAGDAETTLFRQEGVFWLSRAAWAGDARAQGRLAEALSGAQGYAASHLGPDPEAALMWSLVYTANGSRDVYGLRPLPSLVTEHIVSALSADAEERARQKAVQFTRVTMEAFVAPAMPQTARGGRDSGSGRRPGGGDRPPRRQLETAS